MHRTTKFVATIMAMCLVITLGVLGIFAVKTLNMSVGGNITFSADGLSLEVFGGEFKTTNDADYSNITTQEGKLQGFVLNTDTKQSDIQSKIDSWTNLELTLDSKGDAVLHFAVQNNMTTPLYVYVATELGENTNNNMDILVSPNGAEIGAGIKKDFTIKFDIIDTNINAGLAGFNVAVNFAKESLLATQNKIDQATGLETTEVDYYYVEMGTYNGQPVKWRYVADVNGTRYDGTSAVSSLSGYYVLETYVPLTCPFLAGEKYDTTNYKHTEDGYTSINANDYGTSDIRAYLKSTDADGFAAALNISKNNAIYSMINARTLSDLYAKIVGIEGNPIPLNKKTSYCFSLSGDKNMANQSDKFWLMSDYETMTFFETNEERVWGSSYWLRSPYINDSGDSHLVHSTGEISTLGLAKYAHYVRPCFKIA